MNKTRILVVDDNLPVAKLVGARLEKTGQYEVRIEHVSTQGLSVAKEFQPALFLLDVEMPGKNGIELARELRSHPTFRDVPVLFLTSLVSEEEAGAKELISGGNRFLSKSAPVEVMHACITRALATTANSHC